MKPNNSYNDYTFRVNKEGKYKIVLDTDNKQFNGIERNNCSVDHITMYKNKENLLSLYLPQRVGLILKLIWLLVYLKNYKILDKIICNDHMLCDKTML